jgi:hypothetical protein
MEKPRHSTSPSAILNICVLRIDGPEFIVSTTLGIAITPIAVNARTNPNRI